MEHLAHILFIDIETATLTNEFSELSEGLQQQWIRKSNVLLSRMGEDKEPATFYEEKAGIFAEFGKVVCIGLGCYMKEDNEWKFVLKSITDNDEKVLLNRFIQALAKFSSLHKTVRLCGHNIREFDLPFLCRRMIIHGMDLPKPFRLHGMKPWEIPHIDTLELWRFGDYKHYTTLALLAEVLGIPTPKDDIDGSRVSSVYWKENDPERISKYCLKDVLTTAKIFLRLKGIEDIDAGVEYL